MVVIGSAAAVVAVAYDFAQVGCFPAEILASRAVVVTVAGIYTAGNSGIAAVAVEELPVAFLAFAFGN